MRTYAGERFLKYGEASCPKEIEKQYLADTDSLKKKYESLAQHRCSWGKSKGMLP